MFRSFLTFVLLFSALQAEWEQLFPHHEDPTVTHHVNVISGHLSLSLIDTVIQGPTPLPIMRTYSSSGALERTYDDRDLKLCRLQDNAVIQGGWSFLPHLHLLIERGYSKKTCKAYLGDTSGTLEYTYSHQEENHVYILTPSKTPVQHAGSISARNNLSNYRLKIEAKNGRAVLYLPTGGSRVYEGYSVKTMTYYPMHYKLKQERLPNGHVIDYSYDKDGMLVSV